jgi:hypothetical protein
MTGAAAINANVVAHAARAGQTARAPAARIGATPAACPNSRPAVAYMPNGNTTTHIPGQ